MKKRLLAMALMCMMMFSVLGTTAFAGDHDDLIMPLSVLYPNSSITGPGKCQTTLFTATPGEGKFIQYWFQNLTGDEVHVYLRRTDSTTRASQMDVAGDDQKTNLYSATDADKATYYVVIEDATGKSAVINGNVSVAQYEVAPN